MRVSGVLPQLLLLALVAPAAAMGPSWMPLVYGLGSAWVLVMTLVIVSFCCCRGGTFTNIETTAPAGQGAVPAGQSLIRFRKVERGKSAMRMTGGPNLEFERAIRMGFIRKVYSILSTQLLVTVAIIVAFVGLSFYDWDPFKNAIDESECPVGGHELECYNCERNGTTLCLTDFGYSILSNSWITWVLFVPMIAFICLLHCVKNTYPVNYIVLFLYTGVMGVFLGFICTSYFAAGWGDQVLMAAGITVGIFLALTLFTMQSKVDFAFLGPFLFAALWILILWSLFTSFFLPGGFGGFTYHKIFSLVGALVFCGFIIYDTNNIIRKFGVDDFIIAAIELYLDVINLFLYLLALLSGGRNNN